MDIGKAVPAWINDWAKDLAQAWEVMGDVRWQVDYYEYVGAEQGRPRESGPEDLWHLTMFPMPVVDDGARQLVPEARVDVLAIQGMLDDVEDVSLMPDGALRVSGTKNKVMVEIDLRHLPPDDDKPEK